MCEVMKWGKKYEDDLRYVVYLSSGDIELHTVDLNERYATDLTIALAFLIEVLPPLNDGTHFYYNGQYFSICTKTLSIYTAGRGKYALYQKIEHTRQRILQIVLLEAFMQKVVHAMINKILPQPIAEEIVPQVSRVEELIAALVG